jgi:hypothetical protein
VFLAKSDAIQRLASITMFAHYNKKGLYGFKSTAVQICPVDQQLMFSKFFNLPAVSPNLTSWSRNCTNRPERLQYFEQMEFDPPPSPPENFSASAVGFFSPSPVLEAGESLGAGGGVPDSPVNAGFSSGPICLRGEHFSSALTSSSFGNWISPGHP